MPLTKAPYKQMSGLNSHIPQSMSEMYVDMNRIACIILGGGQGTRLFPLTLTRCKPAVWFGGRYRLIDVPISNSINSHIHKIFVVTQFLSSSLHRHIFQTYHRDAFSSGFIEVLAAEQKPTKKVWFQGTADAVRENLDYFIETPVDYFLILSGDQLYNIDFQEMMRFATKTDADLVIASLPVSKKEAGRMGIFKMNDRFEITNFHEKPEDEALLERFSNSEELFDKIGLLPQNGKHYLGSMGIYLFKRSALFDLLKEDPREDFGKHLIPTKVKLGKVAAFIHNGYWEDIGTIESFYRANLNLTNDYPDFDYYNEANPLFTTRYNLPAPKISQAKINKSIICEGSIVQAKEVSQSILGPRTVIKKGSMIKDTYIMGNDFYHPPIRHMNKLPEHLFIGEHCLIKKAIIDKNVFIGNHVQLINRDNLTHFNGDNIYIRDGVIVVPRGATIPDHYCL